MICSACSRDNVAGRRYCGGCGCNFAPGCERCGFGNTQHDRYCGGCGLGLCALPPGRVSHLAAPLANAPGRPQEALPIWAADELGALFKPAATAEPELPALPEAGIGQDDIDRVFGATA